MKVGVAAGIGGLIYSMFRSQKAEPAPAVASPRPATMMPPEKPPEVEAKKWDMVDEQGFESFPASDPPGNY